jgi:hypothetical protein
MEQIPTHGIHKRAVWYALPCRMLSQPSQAAREIAGWKRPWPGLAVALSLGLYLSLTCYRSHLNHDYPPPPVDLLVWIATWGEFSMLPLPWLGIPLERYRLFMAVISLPVVLGSWIGMAFLARLLTGWFGSGTSFRQYLNLLSYSFFPFWFLATLGDGMFNAILGSHLTVGLRGEYGPLVQAAFTYYPPLLYTVLFGLGAVYNGLVTYGASSTGRQLLGWQAGLIGWLTFLPPLVLVSLLYR